MDWENVRYTVQLHDDDRNRWDDIGWFTERLDAAKQIYNESINQHRGRNHRLVRLSRYKPHPPVAVLEFYRGKGN